jgi:hypothetical protein
MKLQLAVATMMIAVTTISGGCSSGGSDTPTSSGGAGGNGASGGSVSNGGAGGTSSGAGGSDTCSNVTPCGGDVVGTWDVRSSCLKTSGTADISFLGLQCLTAEIAGTLDVTGTVTFGADGRYTDNTVATGSDSWGLDASCLNLSGTTVSCDGISYVFSAILLGYGYENFGCADAASGGGCTCQGTINSTGGLGLLYNDLTPNGNYESANNTLSLEAVLKYSYCVNGSELTVTPNPGSMNSTPYTGTVVLQKSGGGTGGAGGSGGTSSQGGRGGTTTTGGTIASGGTAGSGGSTGGGVGGARGGRTGRGGTTSATGGTTSTGGSTASGGRTGDATGGTTSTGGSTASGGSTSGGSPSEGPCDIYAAANMPCVAAYSMVRALSKSYTGPLFQVRAGSSSNNNTMSGGTTKDIMPGPDGFVDSATVDAACGSGYCTVSVLYDHSGNGNDLQRAPKGNTAGGATGALDDYESIATKGQVTAGGHQVYSLYMNKTEGYRVQTGVKGNKIPTGTQPQGTYELADGTRGGTACCWDFGNVTPNPATEWRFMDALCFGVTWWGKGAGSGPWFGADFEGGVWAGGTNIGDPGYGGLDNVGPANTKNPALNVPFALGFLRVQSSEYAIRVADLSTANDLTTAYQGGVPVRVDHVGGIVLGVGGDNSNNSFGTFYEGAIVAGYPTNDLELAVMKNIKAVGYSK